MTHSNLNPSEIIDQLQLLPHPEGGFFREMYRSTESIKNGHLAGNYDGDRNYSTAIYFLLTAEMFSAFHRIEQDELWFFHQGAPIELHTISPEGMHDVFIIGNDLAAGQHPQLTVPAKYWFAAKVIDGGTGSLVSCTVAPGFDFRDFELPSRQKLTALFPQHAQIIEAFTRID